MKKITITTLLLITTITCFAQYSKPAPAFKKPDYLKKSKNQNVAAFVILGTGVALITTGMITSRNTKSKGGHEAIVIISGLVVSTVSIPFVISSHANKKKGMSIALKSQELPQLSNSSFVYKAIPSIHIKVNL